MRAARFNELIKWSNLSRLASGNLPKMTIAAPFVAFIILHNEPLQPFLELAENRHPVPLIEYLALARFDIFYLGLVIVGIGVALYTILSPAQVSHRDGFEGYLHFKEQTKSTNGVAGSLRLTLAEFLKDATEDSLDLEDFEGTAKFPRRFREGLHSFLESVGFELVASGAAADLADEDEVATNRLLKLLHHRSGEDTGIWRRVYRSVEAHSVDIFRLEYLRADYSAPAIRAAVFWLLVIGTGIVLIPTVITTSLVISDLVNAAHLETVPALPAAAVAPVQ